MEFEINSVVLINKYDVKDIEYQLIPLDYQTAKEIKELKNTYSIELEQKKNEIVKKQLEAQRENSGITVEEVNRLIDEYNNEVLKREKEIRDKYPKYDENNWKKLEGMKIEYSSNNTAVIVFLAKATYKNGKIGYYTTEGNMNYEFLEKEYQIQQEQQQQQQEQQKQEEQQQQQEQQQEQQKQEEQQQEKEQKQVQQKNNNEQATTKTTISKLPFAGLNVGIIFAIIGIAIIGTIFYIKKEYWKDIK